MQWLPGWVASEVTGAYLIGFDIYPGQQYRINRQLVVPCAPDGAAADEGRVKRGERKMGLEQDNSASNA